MQSIYRFRAAEVSLFLEAQRTGRIGSVVLERLTLARNFRSQCGLVDWVNATFLRLLAARASGARRSRVHDGGRRTRPRCRAGDDAGGVYRCKA